MNTTFAGENRGLTGAEVAHRVATGQVNVAPDGSSRSLWDIIRGNLFTLFNAILGTALILVLIVGSWRDAVFGFVLISNALIGGLSEYRAKLALDRLAILDAPHAQVLRDQQWQQIEVGEIVADDVLRVHTGDQVPADGLLLESTGLEVDESMLTGESEPLDKDPGDEVLSGSAVVAGSGVLRATRVGRDGYANRITAQARRFSLVQSELRRGINTVLVLVSWVILPIGALLVWSQVRSRGGWAQVVATGEWRDSVVSAVAGLVGMVPEGLVLLTSINFALAAIILARRKVLVQELPAVEILARVDVLCVDKTGTLTDGTVQVDELITLAEQRGAPQALAGLAASTEEGPTVRAIGPALEAVTPAPIWTVVPFSSARKWSAHGTADGTWLLGAPEVLLSRMARVDEAILARVRTLTADGGRVVLFAFAGVDEVNAESGPPADLIPTHLAVLSERIRPDAPQTLAYFREQGVQVKVLSGDNPATAASVAEAVGLRGVDGGELEFGVDARELTEDPEEIAAALDRATVFGRVHPEQKRSFVHALQARGHTVAMTGDGVNDALALKDADLGIAMGSGAAATKAVSRLVLMSGEFAALPGVVAEGRRVIANMERVASLFLTKTVYAVLLAVVVAIVAWDYPFLPRHLTLVGTLTIGLPAFFLALAPTNQRYRPGFLRRVLWLSVPCGLIAGTGVLIVYGIQHWRGLELQANTGATLVLVVMALWLLGILARPWNGWRLLLITAMAGAAAGAMVVGPVRRFFALEVPEPLTTALIVLVGVLGCIGIEIAHRLRRARLGVGDTTT